MTRQVLMVLGSSRGGAGLAAAVLGSLGYTIPPPVATMSDTSSDDVGVSTWLADFHNDLLRRSSVLTGDARPEAWGAVSDSCYDEATIAQAQGWLAGQLAGAEHILLRDPRLTWFTTLWEQAARGAEANPAYLLVVSLPEGTGRGSGPWSPTQSTPTDRVASWINTTLYAERATRGKPRAIISRQQLAGDWTAAIAAVDTAIGLPPVSEVWAGKMAAAGRLIDKSLAAPHPGWQPQEVAPAVSDLADRVWTALQGAMVGTEEDRSSDLEALRAEYRALYRTAAEIARSSIVIAGRGSPSTSAGTGAKSVTPAAKSSLTLRAARLIPPRLRHAVPRRVRNKLVKLI